MENRENSERVLIAKAEKDGCKSVKNMPIHLSNYFFQSPVAMNLYEFFMFSQEPICTFCMYDLMRNKKDSYYITKKEFMEIWAKRS